VVVNVDTTGSINSDLSGNCYSISGQIGIGAYAPGSPPTVFPGQAPLKAGIRIKAGSKLILQNHYPIGSTGEVDSTQIRLYFYPAGTTGVRNIYVSTPLQHWGLNIPANTTKTYTQQTVPLSYTASVFAIFPHSHKVCTKITNLAFSGTDTVPLIKINRWDFEWQGFYTFKKMPKVNQSYRLFGRHFYDNTTNNPAITTPSNVAAGTDSDDEMFFDGWQYLLYQPGDENINVDSLLSNDTTFAISVKDVKPDMKSDLHTYAFPNPFENSVRIGYSLKSPLHVTVEIFNIYGQLVGVVYNGYETSGVHEHVWDGKTNSGMKVPAGTYFYKVRAGNTEKAGKLSVIPEK
jgi:hypothetical protein